MQILCWINIQNYYCKNIIYKEEDTVENIYFIKSGEIEITEITEIN